eukprot:TRINITY_DN3373_c0_g1_i1.p1 TRINITY_DN3373_c0_g1~~TRINITY_DN3373_c0_g1_i1.p1  ORF type:complete len:1492 (+),score=442.42 TRINITY_DN3373_c0_g1_i1:647-4477(+)
MDLGEAIAAPLVSDRPDGLFPTVVVDERGTALGLVYSSKESIKESVKTLRGVYHSRKRGLWRKGETSGDYQELLQIKVDCDRDAISFVVKQHGDGFCHLKTTTCFGEVKGIDHIMKTFQDRIKNPQPTSYTNKLLSNETMLKAKILEEAKEVVEAKTKEEVIHETADLFYFALVNAAKHGVTLHDIDVELNHRTRQVNRRHGAAKIEFLNVVSTPNTTTEQPKAEAPKPAPQQIEITDYSTVTIRRLSPEEVLGSTCDPIDPKALSIARDILNDVKSRGLPGLLEHAQRLGDISGPNESVFMTREELKQHFDNLPKEHQETLLRTAERIRSFAQSQRDCLTDLVTTIEGGRAGHRVLAVDKAGCYAPGGRFPLPSSVLMTAVTARVAGVKTVWVASPRPSSVTAAAAYVAGADGLLRVGGAQAIAAFAYGSGPIPAMDVIVGPGNKFVTAAKSLVSGDVKIDMLAGPSECLVVADETADPATVAADLLAQAEHDTEARPLLVALSESIVDAVEREIRAQLEKLSTAPIAAQSITKHGVAVVARDVNQAIAFCDRLAPEHLELHVENAPAIASKLSHYGALFVGHHSAEVLGDYGAGPNHVLPTGRTSRYTGGLSVLTFLKVHSWLQIEDPVAALPVVRDAVTLGQLEGLYGHAAAAAKRLHVEGEKSQTSAEIVKSRLVRNDLSNIGVYHPIQPLEVLAEEIGLPVAKLAKLDANENLYGPLEEVRQAVANANLHIYPDPGQTYLRRDIAEHYKVKPEQVVVGTGSDDLLDVLIRVVDPKAIVISTPTFGMYSFLGKINKARIVDVPRDTNFDVDVNAVAQAVKKNNAKLMFFATPNNPTGNALTEQQIVNLCSQNPDCVVALDEAYIEFSNAPVVSSIPLIEKFPNLVIFRTFSKYSALAGIRVGFAVAHPELASVFMGLKQPYNMSSVADVAARACIKHMDKLLTQIDLIKAEKVNITSLVSKYAWLKPVPSETNFMLVEVINRPAWLIKASLRRRGVLVRHFDHPRLSKYIRISVGRPADTELLKQGLDELDAAQDDFGQYKPEGILFDMDGVLVDVTQSYRQAIILTAAHFGVTVTQDDIKDAKAEGNANNDWILTQRLIAKKTGTVVPLQDVIDKFEELYVGNSDDATSGLWRRENPLVTAEFLETLAKQMPLAVVTGRPRRDAERFLNHTGFGKYFKAVVCMEDTALPKPSPQPVESALKQLGVKRAWMIGDTPDDIIAATGACVVGIGALYSPGANDSVTVRALQAVGALRVTENATELLPLLAQVAKL